MSYRIDGQLYHSAKPDDIRASAAHRGMSVPQYIQYAKTQGYNFEPQVEQTMLNPVQTRASQFEQGLGTPMDVEGQNALRTVDAGAQLGAEDPLYKPLMDREAGNLAELNPQTYNRYARDIGNIQSGVDPNQQQWGADQYRRYATGQDSVVAQQTALGRDQLARDAASQVASARGGYNPALARSAMMARTQGNADLSARGAVGQAQERQSALGGYMTAQGQTDQLRRGLADDQSRRVGQQAAMSGMADQTAAGLLDMRQGLKQQGIDNYHRSLGQQYGARTPEVKQPGFMENLLGFGASVAGTALPWVKLFTGGNRQRDDDRRSRG